WTTQIVMINSSTQTMRGDLQFVDQETRVANSLSYSIAPQAYYSFQSPGTGPSTQSGFVRVVPVNSGNVPGTFAVFSLRKSGITVTETVLPPASSESGSMNAGISLFLHFRLWTKLRRRCGPSLHFHSMSLAAVSRLRSCYSAAGRIHHPGESCAYSISPARRSPCSDVI